jgi:hypothetical protein
MYMTSAGSYTYRTIFYTKPRDASLRYAQRLQNPLSRDLRRDISSFLQSNRTNNRIHSRRQNNLNTRAVQIRRLQIVSLMHSQVYRYAHFSVSIS